MEQTQQACDKCKDSHFFKERLDTYIDEENISSVLGAKELPWRFITNEAKYDFF